jgi:hypothetical protein
LLPPAEVANAQGEDAMRLSLYAAALAVAVSLVVSDTASRAQEAPVYLSKEGDQVVVYVHHVKAEDFSDAVKLVEDGFTAAQRTAADQTRRNYFLVNPTTYDMVVVSFFAPGSSVDEWHKFTGGLGVIHQLEPMWSEPRTLERYTVDAVTNVAGKAPAH